MASHPSRQLLTLKNFENNARLNDPEKVNDLNVKFHSTYADYCTSHENTCNCDRYHVSKENVIDAVMCLKGGEIARRRC